MKDSAQENADDSVSDQLSLKRDGRFKLSDIIIDNQQEIIFKLDKLLELNKRVLLNLEFKNIGVSVDDHLADLGLVENPATTENHHEKNERNKKEILWLAYILVGLSAVAALAILKYLNFI